MYYSLINDDKPMFERVYRYFEKELLTESFHIKWRSGKDVTCNASIDDLRIIGVLFGAYENGEMKIFSGVTDPAANAIRFSGERWQPVSVV